MTATHTRRGKTTEQAVARWLRDHGFPGAERTVRTGYRQATRELTDAGDLDLAPGLVAQVKTLRPANRMERAIPDWIAATEQQRRAAHADVALLIVRRDGTGDVGEWWAWLMLVALECLRSGDNLCLDDPDSWTLDDVTPLRLQVADAARLLRTSGYGTPLETLNGQEVVDLAVAGEVL